VKVNETMRKLRLGIIGAGKISTVHLQFLCANPNVQVISICDTVISKAKQQAQRFDIPYVFDSWEALLDYDHIDAVDVLLPHNLHASISSIFLRHDKHVICEKPLAITHAEVTHLENVSRSSRGNVYVKHYLRFSPIHQRAAKLLSKHMIGPIYLAIGCYEANLDKQMSDPQTWKGDIQRAGGGILMDCGIHYIDYVNSILGYPKYVTGNTKRIQVTIDSKGENLSHSVVHYKDTLVLITCNGCSAQSRLWTKHFYGATGRISLIDDGKKSARLEIFKGQKCLEIIEESNWWQQANENALSDIVNRILTDTPPLVSFADVRASLDVVLRTYHASAEDSQVEL